jgi:hypothetical protein
VELARGFLAERDDFRAGFPSVFDAFNFAAF